MSVGREDTGQCVGLKVLVGCELDGREEGLEDDGLDEEGTAVGPGEGRAVGHEDDGLAEEGLLDDGREEEGTDDGRLEDG